MTNHTYYENLLNGALKRADYLEQKITAYISAGHNDNRVLGFNEPCATWIDQAEQTYEVINILQAKLDECI